MQQNTNQDKLEYLAVKLDEIRQFHAYLNNSVPLKIGVSQQFYQDIKDYLKITFTPIAQPNDEVLSNHRNGSKFFNAPQFSPTISLLGFTIIPMDELADDELAMVYKK